MNNHRRDQHLQLKSRTGSGYAVIFFGALFVSYALTLALYVYVPEYRYISYSLLLLSLALHAYYLSQDVLFLYKDRMIVKSRLGWLKEELYLENFDRWAELLREGQYGNTHVLYLLGQGKKHSIIELRFENYQEIKDGLLSSARLERDETWELKTTKRESRELVWLFIVLAILYEVGNFFGVLFGDFNERESWIFHAGAILFLLVALLQYFVLGKMKYREE